MTDTNRVSVGIIQESTFGVVPASPAFQQVLPTSASFGITPNYIRSKQIRADRQVADLILANMDAGGSIAGELVYGMWDLPWSVAMGRAWVNAPVGNVTAASGTTFSVANSTSFPKGGVLRGSNFSLAGNNILYVLAAAGSAGVVTISGSTTESPPATAQIKMVGFQGASGDISATASGIACTATSGDLTTLGLSAGQWVGVGVGASAANRFATAACSGWCRLSAITATALTFDRTPAGWTTDAGAAKTIRLTIGDYLRNGTSILTLTTERNFTDANAFEYIFGVGFTQASLSINAQNIIENSFTLDGSTGTVGASPVSGRTLIAAPTAIPMAASANVGRLALGGTVVTGPNYVTKVGMSVTTNWRSRFAIGSPASVAAGVGELDISLDLETYFGDSILYNSIVVGTETNFDMQVQGTNGGAYIFDWPRIKTNGGYAQVPGGNQDVTLPIKYQALPHLTLGYQFQKQRFSELV